MTGLVDHRGQPMSAGSSFKKAEAPIMGAMGNWGGNATQIFELPGGGAVQFDLSRLTLSDYRQMSSHYQINSSLSVLTFMLHQLEYRFVGGTTRSVKVVDEIMRPMWSRLVRAFSQAFTFGFSPNVLEWSNDTSGRRVVLDKIKDLIPEMSTVKWKEIDGAIPPTAAPGSRPPKIKVYDGIKQAGVTHPIPVSNTVWYPLLMQNGDYYGRKLLKYAFQPWYFSTLIHLFSNRYFERFGEPMPVGRAPSDGVIPQNGKDVASNQFMLDQMQRLRSRGAVVLPSDRQTDASGTPTQHYEYDIEYMESQMRGADFERYMTRLDEEISLALFTPLLLMRTADVGSYNLGVSHMQMYLWQLNAIADDWAEYINRYILAPLVRYNFGENAPPVTIEFYKMGKTQAETNRAVLSALVGGGKAKVDLVELGHATGLSLEEIDTVTEKPDAPGSSGDGREARVRDDKTSVADGITARVAAQAAKAFTRGTVFEEWEPDIGFTSSMTKYQSETLKQMTSDLLDPSISGNLQEFMVNFERTVKFVLDE